MPRTNNKDMAVDRRDVDSTTAEAVSYDPADVTKWPGGVDPGNVDDALDLIATLIGLGAQHNLLDNSVHPDTDLDDATEGSIIHGNAIKQWDEKVIGGNTKILVSDGTDLDWKDIDDFAADGAPDGAADYLMSYDNSAGIHKKILLSVLEGILDHGNLAGLADAADHAYALLIDGTRALTGDWNAGGQEITTRYVNINPGGGYNQVLTYYVKNAADDVITACTVKRGRAGAVGGAGLGVRHLVMLDNDNSDLHDAMKSETVWEDPTAGSEDAYYALSVMVNGAFVETLKLSGASVDSAVTVVAPNFQLDAAGEILDANGRVLIGFVQTGGAVNEITITNASAGLEPKISATGDDANIDIILSPKGTGNIVADADVELLLLDRIYFRAINQYIRSSLVNVLDLSAGVGGRGTINFRIDGGAIEMVLTEDNLTFNNGAADTGIGWATNGRLSFYVGGVEEAYFMVNRFEAIGADSWMAAGFFEAKGPAPAGIAGKLRFGDEVLAPNAGAPVLPLLPAGAAGVAHGWHVVFDGVTKCIVPLWTF